MKDKEFEIIMDNQVEQTEQIQEDQKVFDKDDLYSAFIAGFDFEDSFEDWYNKFIKYGT